MSKSPYALLTLADIELILENKGFCGCYHLLTAVNDLLDSYAERTAMRQKKGGNYNYQHVTNATLLSLIKQRYPENSRYHAPYGQV